MSNRLWIRPGGGLGNQLHLYAAGRVAALIRGKELHIDLGGLRLTPHGENSSIFDFDLEGNFHFGQRYGKLQNLKNRIGNRSDFFSKKMSIFSDSNLGYNSALLNPQLDISYLEGFFHTYIYAELLGGRSIVNFSTNHGFPSNWFNQLNAEIMESNSVVLHVRRGDYVSSWQHYGLLSTNYYLNVARKVLTYIPNPKMYVFSDSPDQAQGMFKGTFLENSEFVKPPKNARASESLILMSKAKAIAIANSSFSWWAGFLANDDSIKIYPDPFFRNKVEISNLIPKNWIPYKSQWMELG